MKTVRIRASSFWDWCDCALRAASRNPDIGGVVDTPVTTPGWLGTSVHRAAAVYDRASHIEENPISVGDAVDSFLDTFRNPDEEVNWGEDKPKKVEPVGVRLVKSYAEIISPQFEYEAVEATLEQFSIEFTAEELSHPTEGVTLVITGTEDRRTVDADGTAVLDIKTGVQAVGPDGVAKVAGFEGQLGLYTLMDEATTGEVNEGVPKIAGLQTSSAGRVGVGVVPNAKEVLIGNDQFNGQLFHLAKIIAHEIFMGNTRSMMCHEKYCPVYHKCPYRAREV